MCDFMDQHNYVILKRDIKIEDTFCFSVNVNLFKLTHKAPKDSSNL